MVLTAGVIAKLVTTGLGAIGALVEEAKQKNEAQANSSVGILLGGRPEILFRCAQFLIVPSYYRSRFLRLRS